MLMIEFERFKDEIYKFLRKRKMNITIIPEEDKDDVVINLKNENYILIKSVYDFYIGMEYYTMDDIKIDIYNTLTADNYTTDTFFEITAPKCERIYNRFMEDIHSDNFNTFSKYIYSGLTSQEFAEKENNSITEYIGKETILDMKRFYIFGTKIGFKYVCHSISKEKMERMGITEEKLKETYCKNLKKYLVETDYCDFESVNLPEIIIIHSYAPYFTGFIATDLFDMFIYGVLGSGYLIRNDHFTLTYIKSKDKELGQKIKDNIDAIRKEVKADTEEDVSDTVYYMDTEKGTAFCLL